MVCCARKSFSTSLTFVICQSGYGTRVIPPGSIKGAHFVQTPDYVQITGIGDLTSMNIPAGDAGGELDPHGATGNGSSLGPYVSSFTICSTLVLGNPIGGLVFSSAFNNGQLQQLHEWTVGTKCPSGLTATDLILLELHVCNRVLLPSLQGGPSSSSLVPAHLRCHGLCLEYAGQL